MAKGTVVSIVGPTASGKSSLAEVLACELSTSVVSMDSMQVYTGMDIGTAKTPVAERRAPLLMVDVAPVSKDYSVQLFQVDARRCIDGLLAQEKPAVLCGGTGFYLNAVIDDMDFVHGEKGSSTRKAYEHLLEEKGAQALYQLLVERDEKSAALIHPNNTRRVIRALEMLDEGDRYCEQNAELHKQQPYYNAQIWGLTMDRSRLYERINQRVDQMVAEGLVDEVKSLVDQGLTRDTTAGQAIGYKEILDVFSGETTLDEAIEAIKQRSRRYAKRQLSWFRRDKRVQWIDLDVTSQDKAARLILAAIAN